MELREGNIGLSDATHPKHLVRWMAGGRGKLASNIAEAMAHIRTDDSLEAPDFELIFGPAFFWEHAPPSTPSRPWCSRSPLDAQESGHFSPDRRTRMSCRPYVSTCSPSARRRRFDPAIRRSREIGATEPMAGLIEAEIHPGPGVETEEELERWIRRTCEHTYHPACTARIGPEGDGVVDSELRVHGVEGLRVADASVLPVITRANTNAPAIMVGERCAAFIRAGSRQAATAREPTAAA